MFLIIGLGNPGEKYKDTRHNTGFLALDKIKEAYDFPDFRLNKDFKAEASKGNINNDKIILVKPQTFMNASGEAVQKIMAFYKLTSDDILVIQDDLDIPLGSYKLSADSRSAGHNGVQNIIDLLGTQKFQRIRIGIGQKKDATLVCRLDAHPPRVDIASSRVEAGNFVLEKFSEEDMGVFEKVLKSILVEIKKILT